MSHYCWLLLLWPFTAPAQAPAVQPSLEIALRGMIQAFNLDGEPSLAYELHLRNFAGEPLLLEHLELWGEAEEELLLQLDQKALSGRIYQPAGGSLNGDRLQLRPGALAVIYLEVALKGKDLPAAIRHRLSGQVIGAASARSWTVQTAPKPLRREPATVLGAPLSGGPWAAIYHFEWERGHRRVLYTQDGQARIPGRFAIDFMLLDQQGLSSAGNPDSVLHWYGYNREVLAVADGRVSSVRTDFPESPLLSTHPRYAAEQATGNYISLRIGKGKYVFYEHLQPGSILVKPGERVKKGQVIARLGFTGQSTGPHLHLHLADADSPLGAEGLPFVLEQYTLIGSYPDFRAFGKAVWTPLPKDQVKSRKKERPGPNSVVGFISR